MRGSFGRTFLLTKHLLKIGDVLVAEVGVFSEVQHEITGGPVEHAIKEGFAFRRAPLGAREARRRWPFPCAWRTGHRCGCRKGSRRKKYIPLRCISLFCDMTPWVAVHVC